MTHNRTNYSIKYNKVWISCSTSQSLIKCESSKVIQTIASLRSVQMDFESLNKTKVLLNMSEHRADRHLILYFKMDHLLTVIGHQLMIK